MSADNAQYNYKNTKSSWRKWKMALKRQTARLARRLGKLLMEDAPPKRTYGWVK